MIFWNEPIEFDWDKGNIEKNRKHGLENTEIEEVFIDPEKKIAYDLRHSKLEPRYLIIGRTKENKWMYVVITIRKRKIRVISARYMHKKEVERYEEVT